MASSSIDHDSKDLCLIDCGISSLKDTPLPNDIVSLNLHSNYISRVECLRHLRLLKHLDLSANQISYIEGLDNLVNLTTLNLSCNLLKSVQGLTALRNLEKLNLSYNQLEDLTGLKPLSGPAYRLSHLDLHGNRLASPAHLAQCLCRLVHLTHLVLSLDGSSNPVCHNSGYERELFSNLTQLHYLDGKDRLGNPHAFVDTSVPGLDEFLDYLLSSGAESEHLKDSSAPDLITPKIDAAMQMFRKRHEGPPPLSSTDTSVIQSVTDTEQSPGTARSKTRSRVGGASREETDQDVRLQALEQQIAQLLAKNKDGRPVFSSSEDALPSSSQSGGPIVSRQPAERDESDVIEHLYGDRNLDEGTVSKSHGRKSRLPSYRKSTAASRSRKDNIISTESGTEDEPEKTPKSPGSRRRGHSSESRIGRGQSPGAKARRDKGPTARVESDTKIRNDIHSTYTDIMQELETERERRWKAEVAAKKLVDHIKTLTSKAKDDGDMKDLAIDATSRLKQTVMNEREVKLRLQEENEQLKSQLQEAVEALSKSKSVQEEQARTIRQLEELANKQERESMKHQTHEHKKLQEAQMRGAALSREVDLLKGSCEAQKQQVQSLQSLLASREQEHRDELKSRYGLGSKEMREAIEDEVKKREREHQQQMKQHEQKIEELSKQYSSLEDEFRQALQIESSRFNQLKTAFEHISEENAGNQSALLAAQRKDEKSSEMISELTALVKEQKGRISELTRSKQEQVSQYRERVNVLEAHVEEARKRMVQLELLKQDNIKLKSQVHGQESVIEGLRAERKLWEQELAHQGVSLAQDRGSLEAKLEAQKSEIVMLKKQLERETDGLKIKTKMLEDQTETIRKLKEGVEERDTEIKKCRAENLKIQQSLEEQLAEERTNNQDNQEVLERLRERKDDLKQQLSEVQTELEDSRRAHSSLNSRWKDKSQLIGQLESQVGEMKESWEKKERKLSQERDKALEAANLAIDRLKSADDAFRRQLEDKVQSYKEAMARLEQEKQQEIDQAYLRVAEVEEEMRDLLQEHTNNKKAMEDKMKRLTRAMTDLQTDMYQ
ncbi:leucine-rich repeat and coiled-coil domain-containing protein 1-like [Mya arenaria]|uniref:leucine-rich repeat and coiled-coil domain-containing protein 1-like n=1 Tax=Mya arenaria TaxID=6604 RepID=UPI0022DF2C60|nr:leucine-rich repeat and coiled-coil domain-containing protein 1-like [Mya arenaria]